SLQFSGIIQPVQRIEEVAGVKYIESVYTQSGPLSQSDIVELTTKFPADSEKVFLYYNTDFFPPTTHARMRWRDTATAIQKVNEGIIIGGRILPVYFPFDGGIIDVESIGNKFNLMILDDRLSGFIEILLKAVGCVEIAWNSLKRSLPYSSIERNTVNSWQDLFMKYSWMENS
ncbi:hypothetical protein PMAYCL1PPCAC_23619, partial [Pristionchus mayeri]